MRIVPNRTRALVEDRDQGCRYPGCTTTRFQNHHLTHWADGGATDIETVLSLCPRHHREHHQGHFTIEGTPTTPDGLTFLGRYGHPIRPTLPHDPPAPTHPPPENQPIRGWPSENPLPRLRPTHHRRLAVTRLFVLAVGRGRHAG